MGIKPLSRPGPPDDYNEEIAEEICNAIADTSESYIKIRKKNPHFPTLYTLLKWRKKYPELDEKMAFAERSRAHYVIEEAGDIADDDSRDLLINSKGDESPNSAAIGRAKIKIEHRKWLAGKYDKRFADKVTQEITGKDGGAIDIKNDHSMLNDVLNTLILNAKKEG